MEAKKLGALLGRLFAFKGAIPDKQRKHQIHQKEKAPDRLLRF
jgi:hypothetical protein